MPYLRAGSILHVNLTSGETRTVPTSNYAAHYGGRGINIRLLLDTVPPGADPLGPDNAVIFGTGPLTGTMVPGSSRTEVSGKSPLTGLLGSSSMGGYFSAELKYAGYDHLVITGAAERPVYLAVLDGKVEIRDAANLWGRDTYDIPGAIRRELGDPNIQVVSIGKAGENLVRYASILTKVGDAAGRTGMGTLMGSKKLKAVAVRGTRGITAADPDAFFRLCQSAHERVKQSPAYEELSKQGTTGHGYSVDRIGLRSVGNYQGTLWDQAKTGGADTFFAEHPSRRAGCFGCPVRCMDHYNIPGLGAAVVSCTGYTDLTWKLQNPTNLLWWESLLQCQRYGIDPISVGSMVAWATELFEKGIINERDTDGVRLEWATREAIVDLIDKIANRQGFGDVLADGPMAAAARIGRGSEAYLAHSRNLPVFEINNMNYRSLALASAVGPRGDYVRGGATFVERGAEVARLAAERGENYDEVFAVYAERAKAMTGTYKAAIPTEYEGKPKMVAYFENLAVVPDLMGSCKWHTPYYYTMPMDAASLAELYSAGTGQSCSGDDLLAEASRVISMERVFNVREGQTRDKDNPPERFFKMAMPGRWPDDVLDHAKFEKMKDEYYALRGWDMATGCPTRAGLESMALGDLADQLQARGKLPQAVPAEVNVS